MWVLFSHVRLVEATQVPGHSHTEEKGTVHGVLERSHVRKLV